MLAVVPTACSRPAHSAWALLAMLAYALLVVIATNEHADRPEPTGMIPLMQRDPPPVHAPGRNTPPRPGLPARLVDLAPTPPTPRTNQPLPTSGQETARRRP